MSTQPREFDPSDPPPATPFTPAQAAAAAAESRATTADTSALVPALLAVYAAYAGYTAARGPIRGSWQTWRKALHLDELVGGAFDSLAQRALQRQRRSPYARPDLLMHDQGARATAVDTMMATLVKGLQADQRDGKLRSPADPPVALAQHVAVAGRNAAQMDAEIRSAREMSTGSVWKTWRSMQDSHVRPSHQYLNSAKYPEHSIPLAEPFTTIYGHKMNFPGDTSLGAPLEETINCRCFLSFERKKQSNPNEESYFPAYWIHKRKGDEPHDEMARRKANLERWEADKKRREAIYYAKFGPSKATAASGGIFTE